MCEKVKTTRFKNLNNLVQFSELNVISKTLLTSTVSRKTMIHFRNKLKLKYIYLRQFP